MHFETNHWRCVFFWMEIKLLDILSIHYRLPFYNKLVTKMHRLFRNAMMIALYLIPNRCFVESRLFDFDIIQEKLSYLQSNFEYNISWNVPSVTINKIFLTIRWYKLFIHWEIISCSNSTEHDIYWIARHLEKSIHIGQWIECIFYRWVLNVR